MGVFLVVEPLVKPVVDVMVMLGTGGAINFTLSFPKNIMSALVGELYVVVPKILVFIVTIRSAEVPEKALLPIDVTDLGMFMDTKLVQAWKEYLSIDRTEVPSATDVKPLQNAKALSPINAETLLGIVNDVKPAQCSNAATPITVSESGTVNDVINV